MHFTDIFRPDFWNKWDLAFNAKAVFILLALGATMLVLSVLCIIVPLKVTSKKTNTKGTLPYFLFFSAIGLGFMIIEISQIQRLNIFLGHPTYSLAVGLFTLLLSGGIGSYFSQTGSKSKGHFLRFAGLLLALAIFGLSTNSITYSLREYSTLARIGAAVLILFPIGFFMGMAFPIGMRIASGKSAAITPWLWGINGVMSVLATVLSVIIAMNYGISVSYWSGFICYTAAALSLLQILKVNK
jgi:hypothetical protein